MTIRPREEGFDLYREAVKAGIPTDNHESDLYLLATPFARELVARSGRSFSQFRSKVDGNVWLDVPFAFSPWWERRASK